MEFTFKLKVKTKYIGNKKSPELSGPHIMNLDRLLKRF